MNLSGSVAALVEEHEVAEDGEDRYAIYTRDRRGERRELSRTSRDGIGTALVCHSEDGDITRDDPVGILDRLERRWLVNPWARGR